MKPVACYWIRVIDNCVSKQHLLNAQFLHERKHILHLEYFSFVSNALFFKPHSFTLMKGFTADTSTEFLLQKKLKIIHNVQQQTDFSWKLSGLCMVPIRIHVFFSASVSWLFPSCFATCLELLKYFRGILY